MKSEYGTETRVNIPSRGEFGALIFSVSVLSFRRSDPRPTERTLLFLLGRAKVVLASDPKDKELMDKREIKQQTKKFKAKPLKNGFSTCSLRDMRIFSHKKEKGSASPKSPKIFF